MLTGLAIIRFILAGAAIFTISNRRTGGRFTFRVDANDSETGPSHFVKVLTGDDNETDYTYLGLLWNGERFGHGSKSPIGREAPSAVAFRWFFERAMSGRLPDALEVRHEGRCGRCNRVLTVPESIDSGLGPVCAKAA